MENIECLIWRTELNNVDERTNDHVSLFQKKACRLIETDINERGGIAGKDLKISFLRVPKGEGSPDQVPTAIGKLSNILFTHGHATKSTNQKIQENINLDSIIYFSLTPGSTHPHEFSLSGVDRKQKVIALTQIFKEMPKAFNAIFFHDGKRTANNEEEFSSACEGQLTSINFAEFTEEDEVEKKLATIFPGINDDTILILDVGLRVLKPTINYLNKTGKQPLVFKLYGNIEGRFEKIGFPLIELSSGQSKLPNLEFENLINRVDIKLSDREKALVRASSWRFEVPILMAYASRQSRCEFSSKQQLLEDMCKALNNIDGVEDIYLGIKSVFAFNENENHIRDSHLFKFPTSLQKPGTYPEILYHQQFFSDQKNYKQVKVNYVYIDVL